MLVLVSFLARIDGGSNDDRYGFHIEASGAGFTTQTSTSTGGLENLREPRSRWYPVNFHRVMTLNSTPSGDVNFRLRVFMGNADDDLQIDSLNISVLEV